MKTITINTREIGPGHPVFIIAELSGNHNQDFEQAAQLIHEAHKAGADAVKLQTYTPDTITVPCDSDYFRVGNGMLWEGKTLHTLYAEAYTPWEWQPELKRIASDLGIPLFSTPFDPTSVDFLEKMGVPAYKIASFELVDLPLIHKVAMTGKPIILSTGMATLAEIDDAIRCIRKTGNEKISLLKCTSAYPAPPEEMNLRTIPHLAGMFGLPVGLSDHTLGIAVPIAAVTLGACIIEKHLTLSRSIPGPDSAFSLEPAEFRMLVNSVRETEKALGKISYEPTDHEKASRIFRRSLFVVEEVNEGDIFTDRNIRSIRPGHGIPPNNLNIVIGKKARKSVKKGTPFQWDMIW